MTSNQAWRDSFSHVYQPWNPGQNLFELSCPITPLLQDANATGLFKLLAFVSTAIINALKLWLKQPTFFDQGSNRSSDSHPFKVHKFMQISWPLPLSLVDLLYSLVDQKWVSWTFGTNTMDSFCSAPYTRWALLLGTSLEISGKNRLIRLHWGPLLWKLRAFVGTLV